MIHIAITRAAFEAIAETMPLGSVAVEPQVDDKGERQIWLEPQQAARPARARESYSDVILRLVEQEADGRRLRQS